MKCFKEESMAENSFEKQKYFFENLGFKERFKAKKQQKTEKLIEKLKILLTFPQQTIASYQNPHSILLMNPEVYGNELLQQYDNMIGNIAEWRTNIYSILNLAPYKKQQSPRMQSDIELIQNALMLPLNFDIGDFALQQINIMVGYKIIYEQLMESHRQLLFSNQTLLSMNLLLDLEQKTTALLTYFNYLQNHTPILCLPIIYPNPQYSVPQYYQEQLLESERSPLNNISQEMINEWQRRQQSIIQEQQSQFGGDNQISQQQSEKMQFEGQLLQNQQIIVIQSQQPTDLQQPLKQKESVNQRSTTTNMESEEVTYLSEISVTSLKEKALNDDSFLVSSYLTSNNSALHEEIFQHESMQ